MECDTWGLLTLHKKIDVASPQYSFKNYRFLSPYLEAKIKC